MRDPTLRSRRRGAPTVLAANPPAPAAPTALLADRDEVGSDQWLTRPIRPIHPNAPSQAPDDASNDDLRRESPLTNSLGDPMQYLDLRARRTGCRRSPWTECCTNTRASTSPLHGRKAWQHRGQSIFMLFCRRRATAKGRARDARHPCVDEPPGGGWDRMSGASAWGKG